MRAIVNVTQMAKCYSPQTLVRQDNVNVDNG